MNNKLYFKSTLKEKAAAAFESIREEEKTIGYYRLPEQDITPILDYCKTIPSSVKSIAVIGIGGSSLGAKAVYEFLRPKEKLTRKLYFLKVQTLATYKTYSPKLMSIKHIF